jgi:hypothetical protein
MRMRAAVVVAGVGAALGLVSGACGSSIANPTSNTNTVLTGVMPAATAGTLNIQVAGFFQVHANGFTSVTFNSLSPTLRLFTALEIDLYTTDASGAACSTTLVTTTQFLTTGAVVQNNTTGIVLNNLTLAQGSYCVLLTDVQGAFAQPETYTITISHP